MMRIVFMPVSRCCIIQNLPVSRWLSVEIQRRDIGNGTTTPRDLENELDVQITFMALAESVSARLRKHGFKCNTVAISIRDNELYYFSRQMHLREPTDITDEIMKAAMELFRNNYDWSHPIRSLGVRGADW